MSSNKITLIMAMLVLAVFALGSVSAAENVTTDIDVPTEEIEIDDSVVEEVEIEDVTEDADVDDNSGNIRSSDIHVNSGMTLNQIQGNISNAADGSTIYFDSGNYTDISLTLRSNVIYSGYGAKLIGTGSNHVFSVASCSNFVIAGFEIDVNNMAQNFAAIRGNFVENATIYDNTIYNGYSAINIFRHYNNITVRDNIIENMTYDAISFANPMTFPENALANLTNTKIYNNRVRNVQFGIFIGGNFKGNIYNNTVTNSIEGIQFLGKPDGNIGNLVGSVTNNAISNVAYGIDFINQTVVDLTVDSNNIDNSGYGIYMINTTVNSFDITYNTFTNLNTAINIFDSEVNGLNLNSNDFSNMGTAINMDNINISDSTFDSNVFTGMNNGIKMYNINTDNLTMSSNNFTYVGSGIDIVNATLDGFTLQYNNMTGVNIGVNMTNTSIVYVVIDSNRIITSHFSDEYTILNGANVSKEYGGYLQLTSNYLYGCINNSFFFMVDWDDENNTGMVIVG